MGVEEYKVIRSVGRVPLESVFSAALEGEETLLYEVHKIDKYTEERTRGLQA